MSQSETWDALRLAAEWRDARPLGERRAVGPEMPEPEVKWVRRTQWQRCPKFYEASEWDVDEADRTPRGVQIAMARRQIEGRDWLAWLDSERSTHLEVDLGRDAANFHVGMRLVHSAPGQSATDAVVTAIDRERGVITLGRPGHAYVNPTTYERLVSQVGRRSGRTAAMRGMQASVTSLPRAGITHALTALPGYRGS